jgi:DNA-binding FadR family transcriptional regulator
MAIPKFDVHTAVRVPKTAELVAAHIRRRIVRGELQRDDALPSESALMEQFSVSRPTLREAFRILESEGLITIRRGARGGARVQVPTTEVAAGYVGLVLQYRGATLADVFDARVIVESPAAAMLARRRDHARCASILRTWLVDHEREGAADVDDPNYSSTFHGFNRLLVSLTENETLILLTAMLESIGDAATASFLATPHTSDHAKMARRAVRGREKVIECIEAGDADGAEEVWCTHLTEAGRILTAAQGGTVVDVLS